MAGKKQAPAKFEEPDEADGWEDSVVETDGKDDGADLRMRDWRDVERYREMKELRRLVDDDYGLEEIFHIPVRPRNELAIPARPAATAKNMVARPAAAKAAVPARPAPAVKPVVAKSNGKAPAPKTKAEPVKAKPAAAKLKAKAKRR